jgi:hypothetical protein
MAMSEKPKRKRSPKSRLKIPDWRWRLLILVALYGFIMLPALITVSSDILVYELIQSGVADSVAFGVGFVLVWSDRYISNRMPPLRGCLASIADFVFMASAASLMI